MQMVLGDPSEGIVQSPKGHNPQRLRTADLRFRINYTY